MVGRSRQTRDSCGRAWTTEDPNPGRDRRIESGLRRFRPNRFRRVSVLPSPRLRSSRNRSIRRTSAFRRSDPGRRRSRLRAGMAAAISPCRRTGVLLYFQGATRADAPAPINASSAGSIAGGRGRDAVDAGFYGDMDLSPDGRLVAITRQDGARRAEIWVFDWNKTVARLDRTNRRDESCLVARWRTDRVCVASQGQRRHVRDERQQCRRRDAAARVAGQ